VISVYGSDKLQAAALAVKAASKDLRSEINKATRATLAPEWKTMVGLHASRVIDTRILASGARVIAGNPPVLTAATSKRPLSGGLVPVEKWPVIEFGSYGTGTTTYTTRSRRGRPYEVTRGTQRQLPARVKKGRVLYPAAAEFIPRALALWTQLIVRKYLDALEGRTGG
jgi:hypothetical protein